MSFSRRENAPPRGKRVNPITGEELKETDYGQNYAQQKMTSRQNSRDQGVSQIANAGKEVLRTSFVGGSNNEYPADQNAEVHSSFDTSKYNGSKYNEEKMIDRMRTDRYKESLQRLMNEQTQRKMKEKTDHVENPYVDPNAINAYLQFEKQQVEEEKRMRMQIMQQTLQEKKQREEEKRKQQELERQQQLEAMEHIRQVEQNMRQQEKDMKRQFFDYAKNLTNNVHNDLIQKKIAEKMEDKRWSDFQAFQLQQKDAERRKFYEDIRNKTNKTYEPYKPFIDEARSKDENIDNAISKYVQDKQLRDDIEAQKRQDYHKKMWQDSLEANKAMVMEKQMKQNQQKEDKVFEVQNTLENMKAAEMLNAFEKEKRKEAAKNYHQELGNLVQMKRSSSTKDNDGVNAIFGQNTYERKLQMNYIQSWLNDNPNDPYAKPKVSSIRDEVNTVVKQMRAPNSQDPFKRPY